MPKNRKSSSKSTLVSPGEQKTLNMEKSNASTTKTSKEFAQLTNLEQPRRQRSTGEILEDVLKTLQEIQKFSVHTEQLLLTKAPIEPKQVLTDSHSNLVSNSTIYIYIFIRRKFNLKKFLGESFRWNNT